MEKHKIKTIHQKNAIINNIIEAMVYRKSFLICGHKNPDEDCISSMVAISLLLIKFDKIVQIYLKGRIPDNIAYLLNICKYNSIEIIDDKKPVKRSTDTVVICDTAKSSLLNIDKRVKRLLKNNKILKIEIDHHTGGDSEYIGDEGYCLVTDASSAAELIGITALKINNRKDILDRFMISDTLSRNFVLSILTGIIGDTNMGKYLKSKSEKKYYDIFTKIFDNILMKTTVKESNFTKMNEVFKELHRHTEMEQECFHYIKEKQRMSKDIGYVILNNEDMNYLYNKFHNDTVISVTRSIANYLAENSKKLGLVVFYDNEDLSDLIQFKLRRSHSFKEYDLRKVLDVFSIQNGGGHEGAIGFRFPSSIIDNVEKYVSNMIERIEKEIN